MAKNANSTGLRLPLNHHVGFKLWWAKAAKWQKQGSSLREIRRRLREESQGKVDPASDEISRNIGKFRRTAWPGVRAAYQLLYVFSDEYPGPGHFALPQGPESVRRTQRTKTLLQLDGFEPHGKKGGQTRYPGYILQKSKWVDHRYHWKRILDQQRVQDMKEFLSALKSEKVADIARKYHVRKEYAFGIRREPWFYAGYSYLSKEVVRDLTRQEPALRKRLREQIPAIDPEYVWVKSDHPTTIDLKTAQSIQKAPGKFRFTRDWHVLHRRQRARLGAAPTIPA